MNTQPLAEFDNPRAHSLDPQVFEANLGALARLDATLAQALRDLPLPDAWQPVRGLDDQPTWYDATSGWLARTTIPRRRAEAITRNLESEQSIALPSIGTGAEVVAILARLSPLLAVFVFEQDLHALAAVLRTVPLAGAIAKLRCILLPPRRAGEVLEALLEQHPGLLPPGRVISLPHLDPARLTAVQALCEPIGRRVLAARQAELVADAPVAPQANHIAVLALTQDRDTHQLARRVAAGAIDSELQCEALLANGPPSAHALAHARRLRELAPGVTLCVGHAPSAVPLQLGGLVCHWHIAPPDEVHDDGHSVLHLAASPMISDALRRAGVPETRRRDWFFAASDIEMLSQPTEIEPFVAIVADRPSEDPACYGLVHSTHRTLWEALREVATAAWSTEEILQPRTLLRRAEQRCGVGLREAELRQRLERIVAHALIPSVVLERILQTLTRGAFPVAIVGRGWHDRMNSALDHVADSAFELTEAKWHKRPIAAVFGGRLDPLHPALPEVAAHGWPIALHAPDADQRRAALGGLFVPQRDYAAFSNGRELIEILEQMRDAPTAVPRRTQKLAERLRAEHAWPVRLRALVSMVATPATTERI